MSFLDWREAIVAMAAALSALAGNQVVAFVLAVTIGFVFTAMGLPLVASGVAEMFGPAAAETTRLFSFLTHFDAAQRGVCWSCVRCCSMSGWIILWIGLNTLWVSRRRAQ